MYLKYLSDVFFVKLYNFMLEFWAKYQNWFPKCYSTQYCLLAMIKKKKSAVDEEKWIGALLTDLSKAFGCFSHELLQAKLYEFNI